MNTELCHQYNNAILHDMHQLFADMCLNQCVEIIRKACVDMTTRSDPTVHGLANTLLIGYVRCTPGIPPINNEHVQIFVEFMMKAVLEECISQRLITSYEIEPTPETLRTRYILHILNRDISTDGSWEDDTLAFHLHVRLSDG